MNGTHLRAEITIPIAQTHIDYTILDRDIRAMARDFLGDIHEFHNWVHQYLDKEFKVSRGQCSVMLTRYSKKLEYREEVKT